MKIGFFELEGWEENFIKTNFSNDEIFLSKEKIDFLNIPTHKDFDIISVFIDSRINQEVLNNFPNLKLIATRSTGYDHIDLNVCKENGITTAFVPGYGDNTVAEFAFGLILNLTRKIYQGIDQIKENGSFSLHGLRGVDIKGKNLGVIGTGRIGKEIIKIGIGFGMNIIAYDPFPDLSFQQNISKQNVNFKYVSLEDLLKNSDIITIHVPYNEQTHHLISHKTFGFMKKGVYLINTARGGIVDTEDLIKALKDGIVAGYGADVLEGEGEIKDELNFLTNTRPKLEIIEEMLYDHILMKMPNVLITPHNAFNSQEALERILNITVANIKGFIAGNLDSKNIAK